PGEELVHARLGAVFSAEPDRASPLQVADHDAIPVTLADGDLVDANHPRGGTAGPAELFPHGLLVQFLDGLPVEGQFLGDGLDGALSPAPTHVEGEPLGVKGIVCQPLQSLALHAAAPSAPEPANRELEVDPLVATGEIAHQPGTLVVEGPAL